MASLRKPQAPPNNKPEQSDVFIKSSPESTNILPHSNYSSALNECPNAAATVWLCDDRGWRAAKSLAPKSHPIPLLKQYTPKGQLN